MERKSILLISTFLLFFLSINDSIGQNLATLKATAQSTNVDGRTLSSARNHHFVVDAPPPLGGPNEALNPIELLMSALSTCGVLVSEKVAAELNIPLQNVVAHAEGDLDPRGVKGEKVNPHIQVFRVKLQLTGVDKKQADQLVTAIKTRCPIYTTLAKAAPIELELELK